jgi:NADH:ubiquinone oxidoreductase subunit F (NADH-binding)
MSSKNKQKVDMKSIKEYEKAQRLSAKAEKQGSEEISFDQWWADNSASLKVSPHLKEVIKADFKGRGVEGLNVKDKWNWAAKQFGLNI